MAKQPYHHKLDVLFTATSDVSTEANTPEFLAKLEELLRKQLGKTVVRGSVQIDAPVDAEPGDPSDLA